MYIDTVGWVAGRASSL